MSLPDPSPVLALIDAFRHSQAMFAANALGIFDLLAQGPLDSAQIAGRAAAHPDATARLLEACAGLQLLHKEGDLFANTPLASTYLVSSSPLSMAGYVKYSGEVLYPMWGHLDDAVREGTHRWQQTFDLSSGALFDRFFHTDDAMRTFLMGMHGFGMLSSPEVVKAFDLSRFHTLADLGGATGHLADAACRQYPHLRGILFDLPRVVVFAENLLTGSRVECVAGDFFHDPLPPADLYALGRILHDWAPDKIDRLLARIVAALPTGGALLIAEKLMDADHLGPVHAQMQSLNMLICTEGRERSFPEFEEILLRAGFSRVEGAKTGRPVDAVLAVK